MNLWFVSNDLWTGKGVHYRRPLIDALANVVVSSCAAQSLLSALWMEIESGVLEMENWGIDVFYVDGGDHYGYHFGVICGHNSLRNRPSRPRALLMAIDPVTCVICVSTRLVLCRVFFDVVNYARLPSDYLLRQNVLSWVIDSSS